MEKDGVLKMSKKKFFEELINCEIIDNDYTVKLYKVNELYFAEVVYETDEKSSFVGKTSDAFSDTKTIGNAKALIEEHKKKIS